jgi:hypothetical protein
MAGIWRGIEDLIIFFGFLIKVIVGLKGFLDFKRFLGDIVF